jgi:hypothetical protein
MRILTNEAHPLRNTLEEIIGWMENPVNIDRVDMVPLLVAFRDIVRKEHIIGKASPPLCCETAFTSVMSRSSIRISRGVKLAASSEPTPLLFGDFFVEELRQTRSLFTDGSKSAEGSFGDYSIFDCNEDKGWGYRTSQITSIFTLEATYLLGRLWPSPSHSPVSTKCKAVTLVYSLTPGA